MGPGGLGLLVNVQVLSSYLNDCYVCVSTLGRGRCWNRRGLLTRISGPTIDKEEKIASTTKDFVETAVICSAALVSRLRCCFHLHCSGHDGMYSTSHFLVYVFIIDMLLLN